MDSALKALLRPRSIAILGASADFRKVSGRPLKHLLDKGYAGKIYPVNPKYESIAHLRCYPNIDAIPGPVDLAVLALPGEGVIEAVRALGRKSVPAAVVFASGFAEIGDTGRTLEHRLVEAAREAGVRLCGPNCLGLVNAFERVIATFSQYADGEVPSGPIGFVSQSGAFGTAIAALARLRGLGLGYFVNTGNEADVTFTSVMREVLLDPRIRVGAGYIEGLKDGEGLAQIADLALELGKPLVITKVGRMGAGARAAASHTGSLAGEDVVFDGIVHQTGIIRARNEEHMLDLAEVLACCALPDGNGIGIATQSGGAGVLMADRTEEIGLSVPLLAPEIRRAIQACIPGFGATANPVDVTGQFVADPAVLRDSVIHMLEDPRIHLGIVWLQLMHAHVDVLVKIFDEIKARVTKPFVVAWVAAPEAAVKALRERGVAVLRGAEPAVDAVAGLVRFAEARRRWMADHGARAAIRLPALALPPAGGALSSMNAARLLGEYGVRVSELALAGSAEEAIQAAETLGYPVALKIESPDILHKTEAGGVRLGLNDPQAVRQAFAAIMENAKRYKPEACIDGIVVQKMAEGDVEFVLGVQKDPVFGAVIMAGLGGVMVEIIKDVAFRKCPLTPSDAEHMLDELRGKAVLTGFRGRPPIDRAALVETICAVSRFATVAGDRLRELDLNPVLLGPNGATVVDTVMVLEATDAVSMNEDGTPLEPSQRHQRAVDSAAGARRSKCCSRISRPVKAGSAPTVRSDSGP